MYQNLNSWR